MFEVGDEVRVYGDRDYYPRLGIIQGKKKYRSNHMLYIVSFHNPVRISTDLGAMLKRSIMTSGSNLELITEFKENIKKNYHV